MPAPYPREFREDVVRVARAREDGITLAQIARDFGVHEMTLHKWLRQADIEDGNRAGRTREESSELRDARRRIRLLEQENEVLRRAAAYLSQANLSTAPVVGPFDPGDNRDPQLVTCPPAMAVEDVLLQQREEGFHRRVVTGGTDLAHRPVQVLLVQCVHE